jgi:hypothetical protein
MLRARTSSSYPLVVGKGGQPELTRGEQLGVRAGHPAGGVGQALPAQVDTERGQELGGGRFGGGQVPTGPLVQDPQRGDRHAATSIFTNRRYR